MNVNKREVRSKTFDLILSCARMNGDSAQSHRCMHGTTDVVNDNTGHIDREQNKRFLITVVKRVMKT